MHSTPVPAAAPAALTAAEAVALDFDILAVGVAPGLFECAADQDGIVLERNGLPDVMLVSSLAARDMAVSEEIEMKPTHCGFDPPEETWPRSSVRVAT